MIPIVSSYKYLGCFVDEHLEFKEMVEEKATAGRRALGAWLNRCRVEVRRRVFFRINDSIQQRMTRDTKLFKLKEYNCKHTF